MSNHVICHIIEGHHDSVQYKELLELVGVGQGSKLDIANKYYRACLNFIDSNRSSDHSDYEESSYAIIIYANGQYLTTERLDSTKETLDWVMEGPRILLCSSIDEECPSYRTYLEWCLANEYDLILLDEEGSKDLLINSLSGFRWPSRSESEAIEKNHDVEKKLNQFEDIMSKINAYKDQPEHELKAKMDEIAELFSSLIDADDDEQPECED